MFFIVGLGPNVKRVPHKYLVCGSLGGGGGGTNWSPVGGRGEVTHDQRDVKILSRLDGNQSH